jgi:hypothetical protein
MIAGDLRRRRPLARAKETRLPKAAAHSRATAPADLLLKRVYFFKQES